MAWSVNGERLDDINDSDGFFLGQRVAFLLDEVGVDKFNFFRIGEESIFFLYNLAEF